VASSQNNSSWHARRLAATPPGVAVMSDFFIEHAKNAEFWDIEGRRFIDFAGGIAVLNTARASKNSGGSRGPIAALYPQLLPSGAIH
jgi:4-aminobutyrate aminotransferase-like enzyme